MRIALVHSFYRSDLPSGENSVVRLQAQMLLASGHEVALVSRSTDDVHGRWTYPIASAVTVLSGYGPDPSTELRDFRPDVVHVHNLFPNFGDRWLTSWDGPLVATLHNFRPLCANGVFFRDGHACTLCIDGEPWAGFRHACYRDSRLSTLPLTLRNRRGAARNRLIARADALVVPSERSRTLYRRSGVEEARLKVVHPGVPDVAKLEPGVPREGWLVVGRLTSEKGILGLARMWPDRERLDVVGDGGEMPELAAVADTKHTISLHGSLDPADVAGLMGRAKGLIVPSVCFEGFPTVVAEALRAGTPVIALEGNSAADFVMQESAERTVGAVYDSVEELRRAMDVVASQDLDDACRRVYVRELSAERFVDRLVRLYGDVIASREVDG